MAGNLLSETDALGSTVSYTYTPEGWLKTATDGSGNVTRYTYDATGNVLTEDYAGQQHAENSYNEIGLLTTVTTEAGETKYQYDEAGRLISVTQPNGETVSYTYDGRGNRTSLTYPDGRTVKYTYDDLNRLIKVKGLDGDTTKYSYDELGRRVKTDGSKEDTVYAYDEVGNLVSQTTTGAYDLALEYAYDKSGRMTGESRTENCATVESRFVYDALGQLTAFTRSDGYEESYVYDPAGNMTAKTADGVKTNYTYNAANQLVSDGENRYTYDKNGNLVQKGNTRYTYNALNRLESYTGADGYSESYTYNADGLLSTVTNDVGTTSFVWDILYGDGVVLTTETNGETTAYDYGLERISAITGKYKTEYVHDALGNVAAEVSYNSAWYTLSGLLSKNTMATKEYTPFGELMTEDVSGFGYRGEYYNAQTGAIYLRARFYEPELNRFNQKDILRGDISVPVSLNRYAYVRNDPVNFIDPSGMSFKSSLENIQSKISDFCQSIKDTVSSIESKLTGNTTPSSAASTIKKAANAITSSVANSMAAAAGQMLPNSNASRSPVPSKVGVTSPVNSRVSCGNGKYGYGKISYNGIIYSIFVPEPGTILGDDGWRQTDDKTYGKNTFDLWKFLSGQLTDINGSAVYTGQYKVSDGIVTASRGLLTSAAVQFLGQAAASTAREEVTLVIQEKDGQQRAVLLAGSSEARKFSDTYATGKPTQLNYHLSGPLAAMAAAKLYEELTGEKTSILEKYDIRITIDEAHKGNGYTYYLWYNGDTLMGTPIFYPNDKFEVGRMGGFLNLKFMDSVEYSYDTSPSEMPEYYKDILYFFK